MFAIRGLLATTIKPFLGKFVKRGMQTDTSNGLKVTNIELKEDALESVLSKVFPQRGIKIQHASVGSVNVEVSWSAATIKWEGVLIGAEILKEGPSSDAETAALGNSLIINQSLTMSESGGESLFNSALIGAQKRIEGAVSLISHTFDCITVHLKVNEHIVLELIFNEVEFNEANGLSIKSVVISKLQTKAHDIVIVKGDVITMDRSLSSISAEDAIVNIDMIQDILKALFETSDSSTQPLTLKAAIKRTATVLYGEKILYAVNAEATVSENFIKFSSSEFKFVNEINDSIIAAKNVQGTFSFGLTPQENTEKTSAFDEGKLFMYRSHIRPVPIAHQERLNSFFECNREAVKQKLIIECTELFATEALFKKAIPNATAAPSQRQTMLIEIKVNGIADLSFRESIKVNGLSVFLMLKDQPEWYVAADSIVAAECISVKNIKVAGTSLEHISADVGYLNVVHPLLAGDIIQKLLPEQIEGDSMSLFVRVQRARIAPSKWYDNSDITIGMCDIFTIGDLGAFAITAGTIHSTCIRMNAVQVEINNKIYKFHASLVHTLLSPADLTKIVGNVTDILKTSDSKTKTSEVKEFRLEQHLIIKNYINQIRENTPPVVNDNVTIVKVSVTKTCIQLCQDKPDNYAELNIDCLKIRVEPNSKKITFDNLQCLDKTARSSFNKAIVIRGATITLTDKEDYVCVFGQPSIRGKGRLEDVSLAIDQTFLDYLVTFTKTIKFPTTTGDAPNVVRSIRISEVKMRVNYRPSSGQGETEVGLLKWMPIKEAVIKMQAFDGFGLTIDELSVALGIHFMQDKKNIARLFGGIKPIRAPLEIFKNVTELILIPMHPVSPGYSNDVMGRLAQMRHISAKTIVSVLELVPSSEQQPSGIKQGILQAGQTFQRDMNTIVAFVSGDNANTDLLDVPMMIIRPFTSPISSLITGVCNQLDPVRLERLQNKYR